MCWPTLFDVWPTCLDAQPPLQGSLPAVPVAVLSPLAIKAWQLPCMAGQELKILPVAWTANLLDGLGSYCVRGWAGALALAVWRLELGGELESAQWVGWGGWSEVWAIWWLTRRGQNRLGIHVFLANPNVTFGGSWKLCQLSDVSAWWCGVSAQQLITVLTATWEHFRKRLGFFWKKNNYQQTPKSRSWLYRSLEEHTWDNVLHHSIHHLDPSILDRPS